MKILLLAVIVLAVSLQYVAAECVDNDGGALSYSASSVVENNVEYSDFCLANENVMEFTCVDGELMSEEMPCLLGCHYNWEGFGECVPTAGGSPDNGNGGGESFSSENLDNLNIREVPEFSFIAAGIAMAGASVGYLLLRRRN